MVAETDHAPGLGVDLGAMLQVTLGRVADALDRYARVQQLAYQQWADVHPAPILPGQIPLTAGAGTLDVADLLGPKAGLWWDIRRVTAWGFTAGTVTMFLNSSAGEQLASTTAAGQFTWSGQILLGPGDRLVFTASGVTGVVNIAGQAIEVAATALPAYLI